MFTICGLSTYLLLELSFEHGKSWFWSYTHVQSVTWKELRFSQTFTEMLSTMRQCVENKNHKCGLPTFGVIAFWTV